MSVTLTISTELYKRLQNNAEAYFPDEYNYVSDDYSGGKVDDAFKQGVFYGECALSAALISSAKANEV